MMIWIKSLLLKHVDLLYKLNFLHDDVQSEREISLVVKLKSIFILFIFPNLYNP